MKEKSFGNPVFRIIKYLFCIALCCICQNSRGENHPKREMRAVWLTTNYGLDWPQTQATSYSGRLRQQRELIHILDRLQAANFNTVFFQTRLRGDVFYPSKIEPWSSYLTGKRNTSPGYDPLEFAINECHKRGLECHAWFVSLPIGTESHVKRAGRSSIANRRPDMCKKMDGEIYLNPGHPETSEYLLSLVREIVNRYDVDGIHLDYIRYPGRGRHFPDRDTYNRSKSKLSLEEWRRENINKIVFSIYNWVKVNKPWVKISSSPLGRYTNIHRAPAPGWNCYETVYQDVKEWLRQGKQDFIAPMMYAKDKYFYPYLLQWHEIANGRPIIPGLAVYQLEPSEKNWALKDITDQVDFTRHTASGGQAYYRTANLLKGSKDIWENINQKYYTHPALLPLMNWNDSVPPLAVVNVHLEEKDDVLHFSWEDHPDNKEAYPLSYTIYGVENERLITPDMPGEYIVATGIREKHFTLPSHTLSNNIQAFVITACDKSYNESNVSQTIFRNQGISDYFPDIIRVSLQGEYRIYSEKPINFINIMNNLNQVVFRSYYNDNINLTHLPSGSYKIMLVDEAGSSETFFWLKK